MSSTATVSKEHITEWVKKTQGEHLALLKRAHIIDEIVINKKEKDSNNFIIKNETYTYVGGTQTEIKLLNDRGYCSINNNFHIRSNPENLDEVMVDGRRFHIEVPAHQVDFIFSCYQISHYLANFNRIIDYLNSYHKDGRFEFYKISVDANNQLTDIDVIYSLEEKNLYTDNRKTFRLPLYCRSLESAVNEDTGEGSYDDEFMMDGALYCFYGELYEYAFLENFPNENEGIDNFNLFRKNRDQILDLYRIITY